MGASGGPLGARRGSRGRLGRDGFKELSREVSAEPSWGRLGGSWGRLGALLGCLGAVLGAFAGVLEGRGAGSITFFLRVQRIFFLGSIKFLLKVQ